LSWGAPTSSGTLSCAKIERPISMARPMLPIVGLESKVEQTL
jgi:hypothetical protein